MDLQWTTIVSLIVGGIAGWALARILRRTGLGLLIFVLVGVIGGWAGNFLWGFFHKAEGLDLYHTLGSSAVGGIVLVVLWRLVRS